MTKRQAKKIYALVDRNDFRHRWSTLWRASKVLDRQWAPGIQARHCCEHGYIYESGQCDECGLWPHPRTMWRGPMTPTKQRRTKRQERR